MTDDSALTSVLVAAAREHRRLQRRAARTDAAEIDAVLGLGSAVVLHGLLEQARIYAVHPCLDPRLIEDLVEEHSRIAEDLVLLEEVTEGRSDDADRDALAAALLDRLRRHLERDQRALYGPLGRLGEIPATYDGRHRDPLP